MVVWAWAACVHNPDSCPVPASRWSAFGLHQELPSLSLQFKGLGGLLIQFLLALPQPLPSVLEHSPLLPWAGRWTVHGSLPEAG